MSIRTSLFLLVALHLLYVASSANAVTVQNPADVLADGSAFLLLEAEDFSELGGADPNVGFVAVDNINPIQTISMTADGSPVPKGGLDVLAANTNASGGAGIFDQLGGGRHANNVTWELQFTTPATYYLYVHASIYNSDANTTYGNEDSFFLPPSFNANSSDDWIGFVGVDSNGRELVGDSNVDGWIPIFNNKQVFSAGLAEVHNSTDEDFWDGQFHWMFADFAIDSDANGSYIGDIGIAIEYPVSEADVGKVQTFQISSREHYGAIDAFVFSTSNQLLQDYTQEQMDEFFLRAPPQLQAGDADQDLDFDQLDLVRVQVSAKYLTGQAATWGQGDWNGAPGGSQGSPPLGDGLFNQQDIIAAQLADKYLKGKYAALAPGDGVRGDGQTSIVYNPATGEVAVDAPATTQLTSINIDSASGIFTGAPAQNLGGSFDNDSDSNIFKATFGSSFGSLSFGNVAQPGLSKALVTNDLTVVGSLAGGGALGNVDLIYVPEPATILLASCGLAAVVPYVWRRGKGIIRSVFRPVT
jgi:hypothetical protein